MKRLKVRRIILGIAGLILVCLLLGACQGKGVSGGGEKSKEQDKSGKKTAQLTFGAGAMGANLYLYGSTLANILAAHPEYGAAISVQSTGGFEENMNRIARGQMDLGWIAGPEAGMAWAGTGDFTGKAEEYKHLRGVVAVPYGGMQAVTLASKNIYKLSDLQGKTIAIGAAGSSGAKFFWPIILKEHGITDKNAKLVVMGANQASEALKNGTLDVRTALSMPPLASVTDLAVSKPIRLVSMDPAVVNKIMQQIPGTYPVKIPKDVYPNQDNKEEVLTLGFATILATHDNVDEDVIYNITKAFWENVAEFGKAHTEAKKWDVKEALKGMSIPLAKGAEKYYREKGILK